MSEGPPQAHGVCFLVIDDDQDDRGRISHTLSQGFPGGICVAISNKRQLDAALAHGSFDAVLTAYSLRWSDGLKILRAVRRRHPQCPVIWLGPIPDETVLAAGKRAGLSAYFAKTQLDSLLETMQAILASTVLGRGEARGMAGADDADERDRVLYTLTADYAYALQVTAEGDLIYEWVSDGFSKITGYTLDELVLMGDWKYIIHPDDQPLARQRRERWLIGQGDVCEWRLCTRSGQERWLHDRARPIWDRTPGRVVRIYGAGQDVTQRKRNEALSQQTQTLEAIGRISGRIAHDFNNMLQVITGYSDLLLKRLNRQQPMRRYAQEIRNVADQGALLSRQLMAISRMQPLQPQVMELRRIIESMIPMLQGIVGEHVDLVTTLDPGLGRVYVDPGQLEHVLLNLAANAREAMPHGGQLTIEAANIELSHAAAEQLPPLNPGPFIRLYIRDTGCGMAPEVQSHLFEPFFTAQEVGKGTGLGLFTAYGIVTHNGGHMMVHSIPGAGTLFTIYLPRVDEPVTEAKLQPMPCMAAQAGETILLVEDEAVVRELVCEILQGAGYTVLEAATGEEATRLCAQHAGPLHLLLTDVVLPGISGPELARRLALSRSPLRVLYMSGYAQDTIAQPGVLDQPAPYLHKPFTPESLLRLLRQTLAATPIS
jgi:PAS domain S-box-containing protein